MQNKKPNRAILGIIAAIFLFSAFPYSLIVAIIAAIAYVIYKSVKMAQTPPQNRQTPPSYPPPGGQHSPPPANGAPPYGGYISFGGKQPQPHYAPPPPQAAPSAFPPAAPAQPSAAPAQSPAAPASTSYFNMAEQQQWPENTPRPKSSERPIPGAARPAQPQRSEPAPGALPEPAGFSFGTTREDDFWKHDKDENFWKTEKSPWDTPE